VAQATEGGASRDLTQGILDRIERLDTGHVAPKRGHSPAPPAARERDERVAAAPAAPRRWRGWLAAALLIVAALGALAVGAWGIALPDPGTWRLFAGAARRAAPAPPVVVDPLPVPAAAEASLTRARSLFAAGRLRDAMRAVERVPLGDPMHADAERLRADIQRELLAIAAAEQRVERPPSDDPSNQPRPPE
jgi:hypothetical protein